MQERRRELYIKLEQLNALVDFIKQRASDAHHLSHDEYEQILREVEERVLSLSEEALEIERAKVSELARRRSLVLIITSLIELGVALAITPFEKTIAQFAAIYVFAPLVSAVSGNYGLQTAAVIIRAMAVGTLKDKTKAVLRELTVGVLCGLLIGFVVGSIAALITRQIVALPVIMCAMCAAMFTAGFMGATFPQIARALGFDPAIVAGPAETAVQDLVGYTTFLALLTILNRWF